MVETGMQSNQYNEIEAIIESIYSMIVNVLSMYMHVCVLTHPHVHTAESEDVSYRSPSHMWMSSQVTGMMAWSKSWISPQSLSSENTQVLESSCFSSKIRYYRLFSFWRLLGSHALLTLPYLHFHSIIGIGNFRGFL